MSVATRLLPNEIFMKPFGLLTLKVKSPSHFFRSPGSNLPLSIQEVEEDRGGGGLQLCKFRRGVQEKKFSRRH